MTFRRLDEAIVHEPPSIQEGPADLMGIEFVDEAATEREIRFLDDRPG